MYICAKGSGFRVEGYCRGYLGTYNIQTVYVKVYIYIEGFI